MWKAYNFPVFLLSQSSTLILQEVSVFEILFPHHNCDFLANHLVINVLVEDGKKVLNS